MDVFLKSWIFHTKKKKSSKYVRQKKLPIERFWVNLFSSILMKEFGVADSGSVVILTQASTNLRRQKCSMCE